MMKQLHALPPITESWGPLDFADYSPEELRRLYELLSRRIQELKAYLDGLQEART